MISHDSFKPENIVELKKKHRADKTLIDKVIRALLLLEGLSESGLDFIFKGGTAVMLLQRIPKRFSIDIDILIPQAVRLESYFEKFYAAKGFTRFEEHARSTNSGIQKSHYKFFYQTALNGSIREEYVLLDVLIENNPYSSIAEKPIESPFIIQSAKPSMVKIPSWDDLLADKLTAFAPNTTGIPYKKNDTSMSMEIIKQLYDIGNIFDHITDLDVVRKTYTNISESELKYRALDKKTTDILIDTIETSKCISTHGKGGNGNFHELVDGIGRLKSYIYSERFHLEKAITFAARAAYCAKLIESDVTTFARFGGAHTIESLEIQQPFETKLNKLKKSDPEAFFYWHQVTSLEQGSTEPLKRSISVP